MKSSIQGDSTSQQYPSILALAVVQDGSAKATLRLEDNIAMKAFNLNQKHFDKFVDYIGKNGEFIYPDPNQKNVTSLSFQDILELFLSTFKFWNMTVFAIPYGKVQLKGKTYDETISKPSYLISDG